MCAAATLIVWLGATQNFLWLNRHLTRAEAYSESLRHQFGRRTAPNPSLVLIGFENLDYKSTEADLVASPALRALTKPYPWRAKFGRS